jgi:hypothetical protein
MEINLMPGYRLHYLEEGGPQYTLFHNNKPLFSGNDFGVPPGKCEDTLEAVRGLLTFLTLRPGDTDSDYFANYTPAQMKFAQGDAEELQNWISKPETPYSGIGGFGATFGGCWSEGTLRNEDLAPKFLDLLGDLDPLASSYYRAEWETATGDSEWQYDILSDLFDRLNDFAPEGYYFGAHEGDGACFGYWQVEEDEC